MPSHDAVSSSVTEVNGESDEKPNQQTQPILSRQRKHQQQTDRYSEYWHERNQRDAKRPLRIWMSATHDQHRGAHDHEREQRSDVDQRKQDIYRKKRGCGSNENARDYRRFPRSAKALVNRGKELSRQ